MANIKMKTTVLFDSILGNSAHAALEHVSRGTETSAMGYVNRLRGVLDQIQKTADRLNTNWDDDAQREFMEKFNISKKIIDKYLYDLARLLSDLHNGVYELNRFDVELAGKLSSGNLATY